MRLFQTTYRDRNGKMQTAEKWYVEFRNYDDRTRRLPLFTDKRASEAFARQLERLISLRIAGEKPDAQLTRWIETLPAAMRKRLSRIGLLDPHRVASIIPLRTHLDDYKQSLADSDATAEYVQKTISRVTAILIGTGATFLSELTAAGVSGYLAKLRADGLSAKSSNHYLAGVKGFANWMIRERRASENPFVHLSALNAKTDRRHIRRPLEADEIHRLLAATIAGPDHLGVTGTERYWLYRLAVETGLRSNELRSLTRASFDLDTADPTITVEAAAAKNRTAATLPLRPETASELRSFVANKLPAAAVFKLPRRENIVVMLRADLARARAAWIQETPIDAERRKREKSDFLCYLDENGRVADFHSLRVTFASLLLRSGVDVRTAKDLMRHSTIAMTADVYAVTMRGSLNDAVNRLPDFSKPSPEQLKATGTDNDDPRLALCLARKGANHRAASRRGALKAKTSPHSQAVEDIDAYVEAERGSARGSALCATAEKLPPRGVEPLSSG